MRKLTHPFFHDASILVSVGVFLTHRFETLRVFAHFLCVKNAKTPSIWSSGEGILNELKSDINTLVDSRSRELEDRKRRELNITLFNLKEHNNAAGIDNKR